MRHERWQQIDRLLEAALKRDPADRARFLDEACAGDESLRKEVESLIGYDEQARSFIERPAIEMAARMIAGDGARLAAGSKITHYKIISMLGAGGMGEVYLAQDTRLGRKVALKMLPDHYTKEADRLRRFEQEARAASALNHPNIITIHDIGQTDQTHYIVTEFIDGQTLRKRLTHAQLKLREAFDVAVQVASALGAAHEAGIVHRDIKPENIMLRRDGYVKVLDFGLAKLTETAAERSVDTEAPTEALAARTESGIIVGTAQYMSPEQASGKKVDARSDIFSFGSVLYEMVAGQRAFRADSQMGVLAAILNQEPQPLPANVSPDLAKIILRCLRKDPARRYQTMADLKVALEDAREQSGSISARRPRSKRRWTWAALLLMLIVAGLITWLLWPSGPPAEPLRAVAFTTLPGVEQFPSLSPDGNQVVFTWTGNKQGNQDIYVQLIGSSGDPLRLTHDPSNDYNPVWSPDGQWIAFFRSPPPSPTGLRSRELRLIRPLGGTERKVADIRSQDFARGLFPDAVYLAWSQDNNSLIVTDSPGEGQPNALFVVSLQTGEKRQLTNPRPPVLADTSPAVSPDGSSLVFLRRTTWGSGELHLLPLGKGLIAAGEPRRLTQSELRADYPAWMPDGKEIIFSAKGGLQRMAITGEHNPTIVPYVGEDGLMPAISRPQPGKPARLVYVRSFLDSNFWRIDTSAPGAPSTSMPVKAISSSKAEYHCEFSPDGRRVAFASERSGESEIWVSDPNGANTVQLTTLGGYTMSPHWSPDSQLITFSSDLEGEFDIYVVPVAGGKPRRLTEHPAIDIGPTFSRDGKWIYFTSMRSGDYRNWKVPAGGGDAVQVTPNQSTQAFEAPDGSSLYYLSFSILAPMWRLPTSGGEPVKVLDGVVWFNFWLLEEGAYYIDRSGDETRLQYLNFATGKSTTVARNLGEVSSGLTASPDGKTILFTRVDSSADDLMLVEDFR